MAAEYYVYFLILGLLPFAVRYFVFFGVVESHAKLISTSITAAERQPEPDPEPQVQNGRAFYDTP